MITVTHPLIYPWLLLTFTYVKRYFEYSNDLTLIIKLRIENWPSIKHPSYLALLFNWNQTNPTFILHKLYIIHRPNQILNHEV
jgi:hypothetical protein